MPDSNNKKKKSGILAAIWESMTKTGGCCGSGESCSCNSKSGSDKNKTAKNKMNGDLPPASDSGKMKR
jgi:hypothetical protein